MELGELAALQLCGNYKKKRDTFDKQLNLLLNDEHLLRDFKDKIGT